ncbi:MAG: NAD(+) synthase [Acidobacteriota bacterium]
MSGTDDFWTLRRHGFVRVATAVPAVRVANPKANGEATASLARRAAEQGAELVIFPELGLSAYAIDDLLQQRALLDAVGVALERLVDESAAWPTVVVVGLPWEVDTRLYNCAAVIFRGKLLGLVPKSYLPGYREFYEPRHFTSGAAVGARKQVRWRRGDGSVHDVPFGTDLLFSARDVEGFILHVEICEDLWVPLPPSTLAALAGARLLTNLSASNITIGKADYRHLLAASQSGRAVAAYLYTAAGDGESTTDLAWDGHALIYENGELLAESKRFADEEQLVVADIDLQRLGQDRLRMNSFHACAEAHGDAVERFRRVEFMLGDEGPLAPLERPLERFPFVPRDAALRSARCAEAYQIQVHGLEQRLRATGIKKVVIGISGGLDSTQALLVCVRTMEALGLPRENVLAYSMPGFATGDHTRNNALALMEVLGVSGSEIDIRPACRQMLEDLDHPFARGEKVYDITFENVQAGQRTAHLFRLANHHGALVVGTGDLSELALGWCTYGVGDQMSHYGVNASVPKTLIQHLIRWTVAEGHWGDEAGEVLTSILETEITPELIPADAMEARGDTDEKLIQSTEEVIGPYALQDFHLYFLSRYGFTPSKVAFLAHQAWGDAEAGEWPEDVPQEDRRAYDLATIKAWLRVFLDRFFRTSQFKRTASPNAPKVGSGGSLSPRGDWRAPSDASSAPWLEELEHGVPKTEPGDGAGDGAKEGAREGDSS